MVPSCDPCAKRVLKESISLIVVVKRGMSDWTLFCGIRGGTGGCMFDIVVGIGIGEEGTQGGAQRV